MDLNNRGILTTRGKKWNQTGIRRLMMSARIAGVHEYEGETYDAQWKGIVSPNELTRLRAVLQDPSRRTNRGVAPRLLTGLLVCPNCGRKLISQWREGKKAGYACLTGVGRYGCGKTATRLRSKTSSSKPPSGVSTERISPAARPPDHDTDLDAELVDLEARLAELGEMWADGDIDRAGWKAASAKLEARRQEITGTMRTETSTSLLDSYSGEGLLRGAWPDMSGEQRRTILAAVIDRIVIGPAVRGQTSSTPIGCPSTGRRDRRSLAAGTSRHYSCACDAEQSFKTRAAAGRALTSWSLNASDRRSGHDPVDRLVSAAVTQGHGETVTDPDVLRTVSAIAHRTGIRS